MRTVNFVNIYLPETCVQKYMRWPSGPRSRVIRDIYASLVVSDIGVGDLNVRINELVEKTSESWSYYMGLNAFNTYVVKFTLSEIVQVSGRRKKSNLT